MVFIFLLKQELYLTFIHVFFFNSVENKKNKIQETEYLLNIHILIYFILIYEYTHNYKGCSFLYNLPTLGLCILIMCIEHF